MIPGTINILGLDYKILTRDEVDWVGFSDIDTQEITLNSRLSPEFQREILFHEMVEIVLARMNCIKEHSEGPDKTITLSHSPDNYNDSFVTFITIVWDTLMRNQFLKEVILNG